MGDKKSIVVLGSINMDLVMVTPRIPAAGETMHGTSFESHPGGKGLNQTVACQRLLPEDKWRSVMIGRVGDDEFSEKLEDCLEDEGVDYSQVKIAKGKTSGVALILVPTPGPCSRYQSNRWFRSKRSQDKIGLYYHRMMQILQSHRKTSIPWPR